MRKQNDEAVRFVPMEELGVDKAAKMSKFSSTKPTLVYNFPSKNKSSLAADILVSILRDIDLSRRKCSIWQQMFSVKSGNNKIQKIHAANAIDENLACLSVPNPQFLCWNALFS